VPLGNYERGRRVAQRPGDGDGRQSTPAQGEPSWPPPTENTPAEPTDDPQWVGSEFAGLVLLQDAIEGLEDVAAGRILTEEEVERLLTLPPEA